MHSNDPEHPTTKARAIEKALSLIGEPITETQAKKHIAALEDCATARTVCSRWLRPAASSSLAQGSLPRLE
jgi:hypothetical protein